MKRAHAILKPNPHRKWTSKSTKLGYDIAPMARMNLDTYERKHLVYEGLVRGINTSSRIEYQDDSPMRRVWTD